MLLTGRAARCEAVGRANRRRTLVKILHIFDHSLPLHSGYTFRSMAILKAQRERGWQTAHLTSPRHEKSTTTRVESEDVADFRFWRTPFSPGPISRTPAWPLLEMQATMRRLRDLVDQECPDVLHAHSPVLNAHPALRVGAERGLPVVYEVRGFWEDAAVDHGTAAEGSMRYRASRWLETRALRQADEVTVICDGLKQEMIVRGIPPSRITIIPNAVDVERFKPVGKPNARLQAELGLAGSWVLGFCGSFYAYEGLDLTVRALPELLSQVPHAKLLLVGGGPEESAVRALVNELGLSAKVVFTGRVPNAVIDDYYSLIDVLVFPRKRMRLTELVTPLKPLEAMAQCVPVVASDVGGHKELIRTGETGILFSAEDPQALAAGVLKLFRNPALADRLRRQGREFVMSERSWTRSVSNYEALYLRAIDRRDLRHRRT